MSAQLSGWLRRRYQVSYALPCGNTWDTPFEPFFSLSMAEKYADWFKKRLSRRYPTNCVFITDIENPELGDRYGTGDENEEYIAYLAGRIPDPRD